MALKVNGFCRLNQSKERYELDHISSNNFILDSKKDIVDDEDTIEVVVGSDEEIELESTDTKTN